MKQFYLLTLLLILGAVGNNLFSQTDTRSSISGENPFTNNYLKKGSSQLALQDLSFGFGQGFVTSTLGVRYGYFLSNDNMLFAKFSYFGFRNTLTVVKTGIAYRRYMNIKSLDFFAQGGADLVVDDGNLRGELNLGTGIGFQFRHFGFEVGAKVLVWDYMLLSPLFGLSYSF
ncbi:MAG: hypothetical protein GXO88_01330 [Chlorobi bacterium]|nr:hypothetical protein [Chlorobiota bacterium]